MRFSFVVLSSFLFFLSCSKGGGTTGGTDNGSGTHVYNPTDGTAPVITISTPAANQVFTSGNTISITGTVTDDLGLYRGTIRIIDDALGADIREQNYEIHGLKNYNFSLPHLANVTSPREYTITVFFEDHGYNGANKSVKIKVNP